MDTIPTNSNIAENSGKSSGKFSVSDPGDPDSRFSLSDSDYLDAVNRGDTETVQKMVDEAANNAGYNTLRVRFLSK